MFYDISTIIWGCGSVTSEQFCLHKGHQNVKNCRYFTHAYSKTFKNQQEKSYVELQINLNNKGRLATGL